MGLEPLCFLISGYMQHTLNLFWSYQGSYNFIKCFFPIFILQLSMVCSILKLPGNKKFSGNMCKNNSVHRKSFHLTSYSQISLSVMIRCGPWSKEPQKQQNIGGLLIGCCCYIASWNQDSTFLDCGCILKRARGKGVPLVVSVLQANCILKPLMVTC